MQDFLGFRPGLHEAFSRPWSSEPKERAYEGPKAWTSLKLTARRWKSIVLEDKFPLGALPMFRGKQKFFLFQGYSTFPPENGDEQMKCLQSYRIRYQKMVEFPKCFPVLVGWKIIAGNLSTSAPECHPSPTQKIIPYSQDYYKHHHPLIRLYLPVLFLWGWGMDWGESPWKKSYDSIQHDEQIRLFW